MSEEPVGRSPGFQEAEPEQPASPEVGSRFPRSSPDVPSADGKPPENSAAFTQLRAYLADPHRSEVASQWEAVVQSKLGPEDRQKAEKMAPVVKAYVSREIEQDEYERRLAATTVPEP